MATSASPSAGNLPISLPPKVRLTTQYGATANACNEPSTRLPPSHSKQHAFSIWWPLYALHFAFTWYIRALDRSPLRTKIVTSTVLSAISDVIAQSVEIALGTSSAYDIRRVCALALVGTLLTAPVFHYVYEYLEATVPVAAGWRGVLNLVIQVFVDEVIALPIWLVGFFAIVQSVETGWFNFVEVEAVLSRDYFVSLKLAWTVYPVCQFLSFGFLPSKLRVLVVNLVDIGYTAGLSYIKHR